MTQPRPLASLWQEYRAGRINRRSLLKGMLAVGGGLAASARAAAAQTSAPAPAPAATPPGRPAGGTLAVRWLGGGVVQLATPDYKQIAYLDAWVWRNAGWDRFGVSKPPEYASKDGFVQYVSSKSPEAVLVLLTHDHRDHIGDYFEMLKGLQTAGVPVKTVGQGDLMRKGLIPGFQDAKLDPAQTVLNAGNGINFGGTATFGAMTVRLVPAVHSNLLGFPAAGFILDIGGVRAYLTGDTDLYGDMKLIAERYQPSLGIFCVGGGPFTMGAQDAARACQWAGVSQAVPVHFAHNAFVAGIGAGSDFQRALSGFAQRVTVNVMKPGETKLIKA
jgi:L-ascorbate metabolism protein UlaG (beta-lactamase superfamily)